MNRFFESIKSKTHFFYSTFTQQYQPYSRGWFLHRAFRLVRITVLTVGIYQTGYSAGLIDYAYDSKSMEEKLMRLVLSKNNKIISNRQVEYVGSKIVHSTLDYCEKNLEYYETNINVLKQKRLELIHPLKSRDEEISRKEVLNEINLKITELANKAMHITNKYNEISGKWTFVVVDTPEINAFVSPLCPRKIFVYKGLIDRLEITDDELALILSHEMSHVLLNHSTKSMDVQVLIQIIQLLLLGLIDPTGFSTIYVELIIYYLSLYVLSFYSRHNELEADHYSLEIAYNACFDIKKGVNVLAKLAEVSSYSQTTWLSTHPTSEDRYIQLINAAKSYDNRINNNIKCRSYIEFFKLLVSNKKINGKENSIRLLEIEPPSKLGQIR